MKYNPRVNEVVARMEGLAARTRISRRSSRRARC